MKSKKVVVHNRGDNRLSLFLGDAIESRLIGKVGDLVCSSSSDRNAPKTN
jgi:hypothetical protein